MSGSLLEFLNVNSDLADSKLSTDSETKLLTVGD